MYIIGIDPGKSGARATIIDGVLRSVVPFEKDILNCRTIGNIPSLTTCTIFIERVTASPNMGVVSAFTFGKWAEALETTAHLSSFEYHMVRPQVWQNAIGVFSAGDKKKLYKHARKLFPIQYAAKMFNKSSSDAVLIAYYGWRYMVNQGGE